MIIGRIYKIPVTLALVTVISGLIAICAFAASSVEPSPWSQIKGQTAAMSLDDTSFAGKPTETTAFAHINGGRIDWIKTGAMAVAESNLIVMVSRLTEPQQIVRTVIGTLEELNEIKNSQHRFRPGYYAMTTRFGELRGVTFDVDADGVRKYCVGFHKPAVDPVYVKGFVCAPTLAQAAPKDIACLIDRIRHTAIPPLVTDDATSGKCGAVQLDPDNALAVDLAAHANKL